MPVRTYMFVLKEDDAWWIRVRGQDRGGYRTRETALRQAISAAKRHRGEVVIAAEQPNRQFRVEWTSEGLSATSVEAGEHPPQ